MQKPEDMGLVLDDDIIEACRRDLEKARPYTFEESIDKRVEFLEEKHRATQAMLILQYAGLWTEQDQKKAFG